MTVPLSCRLGKFLGSGGYGLVYQAIEENSGRIVALKKSRVSQRVKRTNIQYESTLLGPSVKECATSSVPVKTVVSVAEQMPRNLLCSLTDQSKIMLIDFGISQRIKPGPPQKYDPLKESKHIVGTLHWSSLAPRDDLESLAYIAFFLLHGDLPWRSSSSRRESTKTRMTRIRAAKAALSGDQLGAGFPPEFGYFLDYSRRLEYDQMPDYEEMRKWFAGEDTGGPLEWSSIEMSEEPTSSKVAHDKDNEDGMGSDEDSDEDIGEESNTDSEENFTDSYFSWDIDIWQLHGARDRSLTLPTEQVEQARIRIPEIVEVTK
ncbi:kinase-like domain-containing protein [Crucibulum laeve]|uniref:Kinase-like domain-containing protein n=1 Tax=Crucibulum laeve TaxID=68775 RepID=A0A5C3M986_9AGAR|nr:kinase-like domain-containing protein [Crucibulum laeve]